MSFLWPVMLVFLLVIPSFVWLQGRIQRRRLAQAAGFGGLGGPGAGPAAGRFGRRRRLVSALFLSGLAALLFALARPQAEINLPRVEGTVMLVIDVSGSMAAPDAEPSRLEAAKQAAREFVLSQPPTVLIGLVTFSGSGFTVQPPANDPQSLLAAIDRLRPQTGTSLGQGILVALNALAVDAGLAQAAPSAQAGADGDRLPPGEEILAALPEGEYPPAVIVLLSDGENNAPPDPLRAAQAAAERGVRVDALGFGTTAGTVLAVEGFRVHTALDATALQQIAQAAGGAYYDAAAEPNPQAVYANLTPALVVKPEKMEITSIFSGAGLAAMLLGTFFSLLWFNRLI